MTFLLGVLVGGLLVCLPLVVIVLAARRDDKGLQTITMAEMQIRAIKRDTVRQMLRTVEEPRVSRYDTQIIEMPDEDLS